MLKMDLQQRLVEHLWENVDGPEDLQRYQSASEACKPSLQLFVSPSNCLFEAVALQPPRRRAIARLVVVLGAWLASAWSNRRPPLRAIARTEVGKTKSTDGPVKGSGAGIGKLEANHVWGRQKEAKNHIPDLTCTCTNYYLRTSCSKITKTNPRCH